MKLFLPVCYHQMTERIYNFQAVERELLKLLAKNDHEETELLEFVVTCGIDHDEICSTLKTYQKHHCLATFKAAYGKWEEAFSIWERLIKKELEDKHFPGYKHVAEELVRYALSLIC